MPLLLLSITGVREKILAAIPSPMKIAISAGIGLFIAFIGLENGGLIVANQATLVSMGDLSRPDVALFAGGILLTCLLIARGVPGAHRLDGYRAGPRPLRPEGERRDRNDAAVGVAFITRLFGADIL